MDDLGDQELKNIPEPVRVYRILMGPDDGAARLLGPGRRFGRRGIMVAAAASVVVVLGGLAAWHHLVPKDMAQINLGSGAKPSIAVLPFTNLSKDAREDYFSDGITNDIITDLSKFKDLLVIASNSVFTYKGKAVKVDEVSRDLGVRYVLEGSVLKLGDRVRINAQLIDGPSGQHLWAERYDEAAEKIYDLQEKITVQIVRTLSVRLTDAERKRAFAKPTRSLEAYDYFLRGRQLHSRAKRSANFEARTLFRKAVERDPDYAEAYAGLALTYFDAVRNGWTGLGKTDLDRAHELIQHAITIDGNSAYGHALLGEYYLYNRKFDLALVALERAIALNRNNAEAYGQQGIVLAWSGFPDGAIVSLEIARRSDPGMHPTYWANLGLAHYLKGIYGDAVDILVRTMDRHGTFVYGWVLLTATYGQMGRGEDASRAASTMLRLNPFFSTETFTNPGFFRDPDDATRLAEGLRKAGLD